MAARRKSAAPPKNTTASLGFEVDLGQAPAFAEISKQTFRPIPMVLPPKELVGAFSPQLARFYAQNTANLHQSRTVATLRHKLLPKLLSGELSTSSMSMTTSAMMPAATTTA